MHNLAFLLQMNLVATGAAGDFQDEAYITADQYLLVDEKAAATFGNFDRQPFVDMVVVAVDYQCRSPADGYSSVLAQVFCCHDFAKQVDGIMSIASAG